MATRKEKAVCGNLPQLAESVRLATPLARFGKSLVPTVENCSIRGQEAEHLLLQLLIHVVRDGHNVGKQRAEFKYYRRLV